MQHIMKKPKNRKGEEKKMSKPTLFDLTTDMRYVMDLIDDGVENLEGALEITKENVENKLEGYAKVIKMYEADVTMFKEAEASLKKKRVTAENNIKRMKELVEYSLSVLGEKKVKAGLFTFAMQNNPASVDVTDIEKIPEEFKTEKSEIVVDKRALLKHVKEALENGEEVEGASLKQTQSLRLR